jgi:hypothetical protein
LVAPTLPLPSDRMSSPVRHRRACAGDDASSPYPMRSRRSRAAVPTRAPSRSHQYVEGYGSASNR